MRCRRPPAGLHFHLACTPTPTPPPAEGDRLDVLREVDEVFINAIKEWGLYDKIWQAFAVFLPVRSVGEWPWPLDGSSMLGAAWIVVVCGCRCGRGWLGGTSTCFCLRRVPAER